ncbi:hypothetical protein OE88DRAFT_897925 [Heliocybe sulcata]|uniref:Uncharacterized protein n=1 Tax=Heliocybe sulcata TaxID=5364 RepID=A0A5C3MRX7_9AGAM|nr:hypothetical protein OE88DRAFT_897925 [Heliocybe sulcata]
MPSLSPPSNSAPRAQQARASARVTSSLVTRRKQRSTLWGILEIFWLSATYVRAPRCMKYTSDRRRSFCFYTRTASHFRDCGLAALTGPDTGGIN